MQCVRWGFSVKCEVWPVVLGFVSRFTLIFQVYRLSWGCLGSSWGPFGAVLAYLGSFRDHFGVQFGVHNWRQNQQNMCSFLDLFLDHFCGSFWSLKTKIFILCCLVQHFCAVSEHPRRPGYNQVVDSVGNFGDQNWPKTQQQLCYCRDHFLESFLGSVWSLKTKFLILYCCLQNFCAVNNLWTFVLFGPLDHLGVQFGVQNWPGNQQNMCYFRDHFLDPFLGKT